MRLLNKLRLKARSALQIFRARRSFEEDVFISDEELFYTPRISSNETDKAQELFEFLKESYEEIAESDPEMALKMLKEELEQRPEKQVEKALIEIESHIRSTYCREYFRGVRIKK